MPGARNFHQWGSVTLFNGLPSDNVRAITQTPDGVMWFGTDSGLARFDGRRMETVVLSDGGPKILALETSDNGALWAGAEKGAFIFRDNKFARIENLVDSTVNAILPGEPTIFATAEYELYRASAGGGGPLAAERFYEPPGSTHGPYPPFNSLAKLSDHLLVARYGWGLLKFDGDRPSGSVELPKYVNTIEQYGDRVWVGADSGPTGSGLYILNEKDVAVQIGTGLGNVIAIEPDKEGGAWVGTVKTGLYYFRGNEQIEHFTFENTSGGLRSNTVNSLFLDREGVLWIGTNRGVCRYDGSSPFIQTLSDSPNSNFVRTLYRTADGRILAGTNRGLFMRAGQKWPQFGGFPGRTVYAIGEDPSGKMLIGGPAGVFDIDGRKLAEGDTRAFANFRGKTYAAIFERGLQEIGGQGSQPAFSGTPTSLFETPGKLWIGTAASSVFTFDGQATRPEPGFENQKLGAIWRIAPRGDGEFWIACTSGLLLYKDGALTPVAPNYDVRDIIAEGSDVWAATQNGGLLHVKPDELFGWVVSDLNVEQGLPSQQVFSLLRDGTRLLIGTNRGIVNYTPGAVLPKVIVSRVLSRRLHEPAEWSKTIELEYPQNSVVVEVAGQSSRTFPEQFQYAFVVKSAKGEVLEKRLSRDAQFAPVSLPPGIYTIEARAFNKDLLYSEPVTIGYAVPRAPFPWTATALAILLFIAVVALLLAIRERRQLSKRNRELAAARLDLANEAERERRRIARDLHDQTLADLRNLMMMSDKISPENSEFRAEIESVSTEVRRICEDLSPSVLENVGLTAALEFLVSHTIEDYRFSAAPGLEEQLTFPASAQIHIYRIAQEVLANIKRHSAATLVEMKLSVSESREFVLEITDNGDFFDPAAADVRTGRGIANIRSRASLVNAEIGWEPKENGGTRFSLRKPLD
jgi:signal transduction histidine kinase/ligand-binding sensor domain-containing protein